MQRHQLQGKAGALPAKLFVTLPLRQGSDACQRQALVALAQRQHRSPHGCHLGGTLFWCPPLKHSREKRDELPHLRCRGLQNRWRVVKAIQAECFELVWHLLLGVVPQHLPPDALAPLLLVGAPASVQCRKRDRCLPHQDKPLAYKLGPACTAGGRKTCIYHKYISMDFLFSRNVRSPDIAMFLPGNSFKTSSKARAWHAHQKCQYGAKPVLGHSLVHDVEPVQPNHVLVKSGTREERTDALARLCHTG